MVEETQERRVEEFTQIVMLPRATNLHNYNRSKSSSCFWSEKNKSGEGHGAAHLVVVGHDGALEFGGVDPGDKVFHVPGDEKGGIGYGVGADAHMALLDEFCGLRREHER